MKCIECGEELTEGDLCEGCKENGNYEPVEHAAHSAHQIGTLRNLLAAKQVELDGADKVIAHLKTELENIKARNVINAIKEICPDCGHTLDENSECANCWKTACEQLHAEFGHVYSACRTFIKDWRDGDFQLPRLAEIHAKQIEGKIGAGGCGDCDPCIGGRPDQCAVGAGINGVGAKIE